MSFSGNLEHLPIVDVIQLLNSTKKSGTLYVSTDNLEYKFGFKDGQLISVTHPDTNKSLLKVIKDKKILEEESINNLLDIVKNFRKPIIAVLVEKKILDTNTASNLLQNFVELTVVDILTWQKGNFKLIVEDIKIDSNFEYIFNLLNGKFYISTQNTLMEALRIFDEMRRDNLLNNGIFEHSYGYVPESESEIVISEDILGLDKIDKIERKTPSVFKCVDVQDFAEPHRKKVLINLPEIEKRQEDLLVSFLVKYSQSVLKEKISDKIAVILFTKDDFTSHVINTILNSMGVFIFTTDSEENISVIIKQSISKQLIPIVIIDNLSEDLDVYTEEKISSFKKDLKLKFPSVRFIHFVGWNSQDKILTILKDSALAVFPKPEKISQNTDKIINFYQTFAEYIKKLEVNDNEITEAFKNLINDIFNVSKVIEIVNVCFKFISEYFNRCGVFIIHKDECLLEIVKGMTLNNLPQKFTLPHSLQTKLQEGSIIKGKVDKDIYDSFFNLLGKPEIEDILIVPLKSSGRLIAFFYADSPKNFSNINIFEILQVLANNSVELLLYRKMFEKTRKTE